MNTSNQSGAARGASAKRCLFAWMALSILFFACGVRADPVSLEFDKVSIIDLAKTVFGDIAKQPVVFTSDAVKAQETVSVKLHDTNRAQAVEQMTQLLKSAGYSVETRAGVIWIDKARAAEEEFFYRPRYRSVSYLLDLLTPFFKAGSFATQRSTVQTQFPFMSATVFTGSTSTSQPGAGLNPPPFTSDGITPVAGASAMTQPATYYDPGSPYGQQQERAPDTFLFRGTPQDRERLQKLLAQVDMATPEVLVKAVVFEVSTDGSDQSAVSLAAQLLNGKLGLSIGNAAPGDYSALFKGTNFQAVFNALATDRRFKAVSSPQLRVQSGATAQLTVGSETPVLGAVSYDINGKGIQTVEYKSSGVILNLKPQIHEEVADLQISQQISNFIQTTTGVNNSPTLIKRELQTTVGIKADDVLILGGMDQDSTTKEHAGISFLPRWLGSNSDANSKTEVLLILQTTRI